MNRDWQDRSMIHNTNSDIVNHKTIQQMVYSRLLEDIVHGHFLPGAQLTITQLAKRFGVSPIPVREAIKRLEADKLVCTQNNRRIEINELSAKEFDEIRQIRLKLECYAARKAAKLRSEEAVPKLESLLEGMRRAKSLKVYLEKNYKFHHTIYEQSNMPILSEMIRDLWSRISLYFHIYLDYLNGSPHYKISIPNHEGMLKAVKERNWQKISIWVAADINNSADQIIKELRPKD
jgi:DNA-binding GntR family transcriptional regulator